MNDVDFTQQVPPPVASLLSVADVASQQEGSRRGLSYVLSVTLGLVLAFICAFEWAHPGADVAQLSAVLVVPIVGLVGTMAGFYFGDRKLDS